MKEIKIVGIGGAGIMGASMAQIFALKGYKTIIYDIADSAIEKGKRLIEVNQEAEVEPKNETKEESKKVFENISFTTNMEDLKECDILIESIVEKLEIKQEFWENASKTLRPDAILATNTSGLSINKICERVEGKNRFLGMHWFNPAHLIPLIEIIRNDETDQKSVETVKNLALEIGKKPVTCKKDVPGFIANRIQFAVLRECMDIVEKDVATIEDVDAVMKYGLGFRYAAFGPFEVADFAGLATFHHIASYLNKDLCDEKQVQKLIDDHYQKGEYGVKSKKGFYDYSNGKDEEALKRREEMFMLVAKTLYK